MRMLAVIAALVISSASQAGPITTCEPLETAKMYLLSGTVPTYYKIWFPAGVELKPGPIVQPFEVKDPQDQSVPDVAGSLTAKFERVQFFYELKSPQEIRKVYAATVSFKSTTYDLDWTNSRDYQYPDKEMTRNVFCYSTEPLPAGTQP